MAEDTQSAPRRAWQDALAAQRTVLVVKIGDGILAVAGGTWLSALAPASAEVLEQVIRAVIGFVLGLLVAVTVNIASHLVVAPFRQRNQARRRVTQLVDALRQSTLFDVVSQTKSLGLPINRLADGTYRASAIGIGFAPILMAHRGELTSVTRLTASPQVWFTQADNQAWETTNAIVVAPAPNPSAGPHAMDFTWDTNNPQQWVLTGLPLIMAKDELLTLPMMMMSVSDANEAGAHFAQGERCALMIRLAVRTDKGNPPLPDQVITLTRSDIQDSLALADLHH